MKLLHLVKLLACLTLITTTSAVQAAPGDLLASFDMKAKHLLYDSAHGYLYASLPEQGSIGVIDAMTLEPKMMIPVGPSPNEMALSIDNNRLFVGSSTANEIEVVDLQTMTKVATYQLPATTGSIAVGANHYLFIVPRCEITSQGYIVLNGDTGELVGEYSSGISVLPDDVFETSLDHTKLYLASYGRLPGTLSVIDAASGIPQTIATKSVGFFGSAGHRLILNHQGDSLYCLTNNSITRVKTSDLSTDSMELSASDMALSPSDKIAYIAHTDEHIGIYDTETLSSIAQFPIKGAKSDLTTDDFGHLYLITDGQIKVVDQGTEPFPISTVSTPTFTHESGIYDQSIDVTTACEIDNVIIHYTLNGQDPTENDPIIGPYLRIFSSVTLKARAFRSGWYPSEIKSASYAIKEITHFNLFQGWNMVSIPILPMEGSWDSWTSILGGITPLKVVRWEPSSGRYIESAHPVVGETVWVKMPASKDQFIQGITPSSPVYINLQGNTNGLWNLIGNPFAYGFIWDWSKLQVLTPEGEVLSMAQAVQSHWVSDHGWLWDGSDYRPVCGVDQYIDCPKRACILGVSNGFWLQVYKDCQLVISLY